MMLAPEVNLEEFSSVESIMRCEDFKSNFARKLSNRYISRPAVASKDTTLKLPKGKTELPENTPERIECGQLSKSVCEQNGKPIKPPDKTNSDMRSTEVSALNMEVETLRWQLSQTETNRQMHIALLKQVVSFLSRVKEHIECQTPDFTPRKESLSTRVAARSFNAVDLPRSRSVVHVNKNQEFSLSPAKKMNVRKISKSINNVNGYKMDCSGSWSPSKLFSTPEEESTQKISEEITRLITLANTVLSTKIPDLACTYNEPDYATISETVEDKSEKNNSISSLNFTDEDITNAFILNTICDSENTFKGITNDFIEAKIETTNDFILSPSPLPISGLKNDFAEVKVIGNNTVKTTNASAKAQIFMEKRNEYNHVGNFIEDESGFSSMSSFQEIGIPIISIIPPSPCKEVSYIDEITDILEDTKWKSDPVDLNKQSVKVFWV